eukprot:GHVT01088633.1.p1 GENE.GHVT01088633.1~~GHVT01088633.1.p1  ORF type:complete len:751 (-),score=22.50 GHVT01088633.1:5266-7518(-)
MQPAASSTPQSYYFPVALAIDGRRYSGRHAPDELSSAICASHPAREACLIAAQAAIRGSADGTNGSLSSDIRISESDNNSARRKAVTIATAIIGTIGLLLVIYLIYAFFQIPAPPQLAPKVHNLIQELRLTPRDILKMYQKFASLQVSVKSFPSSSLSGDTAKPSVFRPFAWARHLRLSQRLLGQNSIVTDLTRSQVVSVLSAGEEAKACEHLLHTLLDLAGSQDIVKWGVYTFAMLTYCSLSFVELSQFMFLVLLHFSKSWTAICVRRADIKSYYMYHFARTSTKSFDVSLVDFHYLPWETCYILDFIELCHRYPILVSPAMQLQQVIQRWTPSSEFWKNIPRPEIADRKVGLDFFRIEKMYSRIHETQDLLDRLSCDAALRSLMCPATSQHVPPKMVQDLYTSRKEKHVEDHPVHMAHDVIRDQLHVKGRFRSHQRKKDGLRNCSFPQFYGKGSLGSTRCKKTRVKAASQIISKSFPEQQSIGPQLAAVKQGKPISKEDCSQSEFQPDCGWEVSRLGQACPDPSLECERPFNYRRSNEWATPSDREASDGINAKKSKELVVPSIRATRRTEQFGSWHSQRETQWHLGEVNDQRACGAAGELREALPTLSDFHWSASSSYVPPAVRMDSLRAMSLDDERRYNVIERIGRFSGYSDTQLACRLNQTTGKGDECHYSESERRRVSTTIIEPAPFRAMQRVAAVELVRSWREDRTADGCGSRPTGTKVASLASLKKAFIDEVADADIDFDFT